jgi:hypothetical protein
MNCAQILDKVYEYAGEEPQTEGSAPRTCFASSLLLQIRMSLHLLICPDCAREVERFEVTQDILRHDFLPPAPGLENMIMAKIAAEAGESLEEFEAEEASISGGFSTRGWVVAGVVMLVSLATAFFGFEFHRVATDAGMSFMLPVGITVGIVLTSYGALFIGSHLKELSERFGL